MQDSAGQTLRLGDKIVYVRGSKSVRLHKTEVIGFTEHSVRVDGARWNGGYPCVAPDRIVKMEDQS